jgi:pyrimidine operon attenuation protein/uracil phosphoribosyltransferase
VKIKSKIFDEAGMNRVVIRMVHEITEKNKGADRMALIGMRTRGEFLARRIAERIKEFEGVDIPLGILDVSFYRDDTRAKLKQPVVRSTHIPFDLTEKKIILIDDVLYTGRSVRAALDEIMDFGRPAKVELAVLIDRGHRELPIQPNYVGKSVTTSLNEEIRVKMKELDDADEVLLIETD